MQPSLFYSSFVCVWVRWELVPASKCKTETWWASTSLHLSWYTLVSLPDSWHHQSDCSRITEAVKSVSGGRRRQEEKGGEAPWSGMSGRRLIFHGIFLNTFTRHRSVLRATVHGGIGLWSPMLTDLRVLWHRTALSWQPTYQYSDNSGLLQRQ